MALTISDEILSVERQSDKENGRVVSFAWKGICITSIRYGVDDEGEIESIIKAKNNPWNR